KDKLTMMDMAVPVPCVFNSEEVKKHATKEDPWALGWTKSNVAGGGAYKLESWKPGQEVIYARYDDWKSGKLPKIKRVVQREIPSAGNRRALMEKGDIDVTFEMPPKDFAEWAQEKKNIQVFSTPIENALWYVGMNVTKPPFNNPKVRQAVAYAIPYDKIMDNAMYGRSTAMWGDKDNKATGVSWPQPTGYKYDIVKARALMKEAGMEAGFETTLSFDLGGATVGEPACVLLVESLALIGIKAKIEKVPGANWRAQLLKKELPMVINRFSGWLDFPEYYFYWNFHGSNSIFNISSYRNPAMDKLIDGARFETDPAKYESLVKEFITLCA